MPPFPATSRAPLPPPFPNLLLHFHVRQSVPTTNKDSTFPEKPWVSHDRSLRMPTAPWMRSPVVLPVVALPDLSSPKTKKKQGEEGQDEALTGRVKGGRSRQAMKEIVQSVARLQEIDPPREIGVGEMEFDLPLVVGGEGEEERGKRRRLVPWAVAERAFVFRRMKKEEVVTLAERMIAEDVLERLRTDARKMKVWVKAKKAGLTQDVVDEIRMRWRESELVMVKFVEPLCRNMDRAMEVVETKTGGLVVWRRKDTLVVYRGQDYLTASETTCASELSDAKMEGQFERSHGNIGDTTVLFVSTRESGAGGSSMNRNENQDPQPPSMFVDMKDDINSISGTLYEREANRLLEGLGPRFIDWWWPKPLPVDADLLPEDIPGFKPPFRLSPPHVRQKLRDDELTYLRKLARPLPTHFALGKNTKLQGLAAAIIKLWEKSPIAKIAVKRGIPNTNNELMSCELKRLTGGILILRNKYFIILYRGNDFLPKAVAESVMERESQLENLQLSEEQAREKAIKSFYSCDGTQWISDCKVGTYMEFRDIQTNYDSLGRANSELKVEVLAEKERLEKELRQQEHQLALLKLKMGRPEKELAKLNAFWRPSVRATDQELLTEEERQTFRKMGLKMDEVLLLGRRGIYDGVIGNIHLHWKHRELVKVITMQSRHSHIMHTAKVLETESGGILVSVDKLKTGHAIIIYRGKNYKPPLDILPDNLPTKREALQRSIEVQRRGSLKFFVHEREKSVWDLKSKLKSVEERIKELLLEKPLN